MDLGFRYLSHTISELAHQLTLSPRHLRVHQLVGVDRLLEVVDPDKSYPYEFICFHITGRKIVSDGRAPVLGSQLLADLPVLAEEVTRRAAPAVGDLRGSHLTHDEVASELGVSTKTIRRWRSRGLLGYRAVSLDGVSRLVFPISGVKRFRDRNREVVERGASFKLLSPEEKRHIIERTRAMLSQKRQKLHIIACAIADETGRAVETIRYTLRQFDAAHPEQALFANDGAPVVSPLHMRVWKRYQEGRTASQIGADLGIEAAAVSALIREVVARQLKDAPHEYMDHELFHAPDAEAAILDKPRPPASDTGAKSRVPKDLSAYFKALYDIPLLSAAQESDLFLRYNYLRFLVARAVEALDVYSVSQDELDRIHALLERVESIKNELVQANLRLVVSIAKRHVGRANNIFEVISDGNISLMRAVEKFNVALGNKFSTYASWSIMKNYARSIPENHYHMRRYMTGQEEMLDATPDLQVSEPCRGDVETVRNALSGVMSQLTDRERTVVVNHFGLFDASGSACTLEDLGKKFGVTKERIRQIEKRAIEKLRNCLSPALLDAFTD